ncbi:Ivy family C-type lysozyme inhibitor [Shimwellia blattae]|uniref:Inhibitor of vertebrate C-lysozyme n=1 Tax=Shimwellia blattae (strain ATCC 29907 / DSM 4481 / JCM 1650 / NBRC 105725 / CDC 9005-74) TaxID=630626 RepID=I2BCF1_SHIBC|nr:Ivy family C-type lysozyme inhibitor [Shimwellia blattae]AFJ48205.1 inhibitor of vertebrate C-lysozyme [Shimwellia blattae DSM 4481 = NBRC 105725]GAB82764.1 vertebrate lysozyme inhibitor [Shimwellia blattae DSM 4481 = NBRC 105725]VDY65701.1 Inhibitor of vertebrate lysozyme precursor [Shimwellia blattae]VEC25430.1 Inhibitor of vertebrate lysozyme precursor [Shimwellia blattae]
MKKIIGAGVLMLATFGAWAQTDVTISSLATGSATKAGFAAMVKGHTLPGWVTRGATESPAHDVTLAGKHYQVFSACKPHDCASERIAVIYSADDKTMAGLFSKTDEKTSSEKLSWLNVPDDLSIDGKTVLFAALSGSLENHPEGFNYQ